MTAESASRQRAVLGQDPCLESRKSLNHKRLDRKASGDKVHNWGLGRSKERPNISKPWTTAINAAVAAGDERRRKYLTRLIQALLDVRWQLSDYEWYAVENMVARRAGVDPNSETLLRDDERAASPLLLQLCADFVCGQALMEVHRQK